MTAQIRPNRLEVNDRFPMLGFSIRADQRDVEAEVALATDIELFKPENRGRRTAANFYSSRESGKLAIPRGEGVFVVPPDVLSRFIGGDKLYFGLASGHSGNGGLQVDALPRDGSPFVSLRGLTGRTIRRSPARRGPGKAPIFDWAGDAPRPGSERPANGGNGGGNGASTNGGGAQPVAAAPRSEIDYDDGFGDLPATPRPSGANGASAAAQALSLPAVRAMSGTPVAVTAPSVTTLGTVARMALEAGILALGGPLGGLLLALKSAANALGCSVGFGPQVGGGLGAGGQLGYGIIFAPNNEIGVYGGGEIDIGFITSISATANVTIVQGGISAFNGWTGALAISGGEGVVGGGAALFDPQGNFVGVSANVGIGAGFSPVDFYVAIQRGWATRVLALAAAAGSPALARPLAQVNMIYTPSDPAQAAAALADFSARQAAWRAGVPDTSFFPHNAICHIEATGSDGRTYLGTGTYIARDLILTAAHVLANKTSLRIRPGRNGSSSIADFTASPSDWTMHPNYSSSSSDYDLGVIRVGTAKPAGPDFDLHYLNVSQPSPIIVCGYAAASVDSTRQHLDGDMIRELSPNMHVLRYNLQTEGGTSGSAVFFVDSYDDAERQQCVMEWKLVGVHTAAHDGTVNQGCALTPAKIDWIRGRGLSPPSAGFGVETGARAMTIGPEDVQRAQAYAPRWADLYNFQVPASVVSAITARGMSVQRIADAHGELNLDRYEIIVDTPPSGMDGAELLKRFLHNINGFVDTDNTEFNPYGPADAAQIVSGSPVGAVFNLNIVGPDNAAVVISESTPSRFRVSTVNTPDTGDHPVSGHREWGHTTRDGKIVLYTRGADRATGSIATSIVFAGADHLWRSFQRKMVEYINSNGGSASAPAPFSERFHPEVVRILYGTAQGMALEDPSDLLVRPAMPNDQRARAQRIGGQFGERIGQALDLGLAPSSVDPLLDKLDPPAAPSPYGRQQAAAVDGQTAGPDIPLPPAPAPRARAMQARAMGAGADAIIEIGGVLLERILNNEGDVSWDLDQFNGIKHPNDTAPANPGPFHDAPTIRLNDWPKSGGTFDDISAWFKIDWQYNGKSLGNVRIENIGSNDAIGWGLKVKARIMNDARLYEPGPCAALRVTIHYKFDRSIGSDQIGITEIKLYGDGTHEISQTWEQNSWLFGVSEGLSARALSVNVTHPHVRSPSGQTEYSLAEYSGLKQPANPGQAGQVQSAPTIQRGHRPWVDAGNGQSVRAPFAVDWQYDGSSVGNVRVTAGNPQEAEGWQVRVNAQIEDEADAAGGCAQLKVRVSHQFSHAGQIHATEWTEIILRGDGTADANPL